MVSSREFLEYVKNDLKGIKADLKGFLEVYYPMIMASWHPKNETDFILGWIIGSKEQEYSNEYYKKYNQRLHHELLYEIHQQITEHKEHLLKEITNNLDKPEETKTKLSEYRGRPHSKK